MVDIRIVPASQWEKQLHLYRDVDRLKVLFTRAETHMAQAQKNIIEAKKIFKEREYFAYLGEKL